jgi:uncharacterized membrane protein YkvA (DUF1232 family)
MAMYSEIPERVGLPAVLPRNERIVQTSFWKKLLKVAGHVPFAEELAAAYFCAIDPETPGRVKGILFAALAYFVTPIDVIPDFIAGLGFTDDAAVLALAISMVSRSMKPVHYAKARAELGLPPFEAPGASG